MNTLSLPLTGGKSFLMYLKPHYRVMPYLTKSVGLGEATGPSVCFNPARKDVQEKNGSGK